MPITERQVSCSVVLRFNGGGSVTYTKLKLGANNNGIYDFAEAVNGMQSKGLKSVTKVQRSELML